MKKEFKRFDMKREPMRTRWYLRPVTYILSAPAAMSHRAKITRNGMDGIKPPYLLLCNHNAFMDFKILTKTIYPHRANYVVAIDGFIGMKWLMWRVGCICKRKFTNDISLIRQMSKIAKNGDVNVLYPEARYSLCGTTAVLPESLGKLCKLLRVPVAAFICHGHHVNSPFWHVGDRGVRPTEAELTLLYTPEQLESATVDEINARIVEAFQYDDFAWQKERGIKIKKKDRAEGLHRVLYQCPACGKEYKMTSKGSKLTCTACGKSWEMTQLGELRALSGETEFSHIPDWYEWERENVRREVESGTYSTGVMKAEVYTLPDSKGFIRLGEGTVVHDMDGFTVKGVDVDGDDFEMIKSVASLYSCHIEYDYKKARKKGGDCIDLNTLEDTWYIYPQDCDFSVTKMALATEELYRLYREKSGRPCKPGLA